MKEDIIRMAREAGIVVNSPYLMPQEHEVRGLERFAALVAAAEREECAKVAEQRSEPGTAVFIRARGLV
jgi:hypothetical protein